MRKYLAIATIGLILGVGAAYAQETTGTIIGVITSQDGATMPGVTVTISDEATGFERTTVSNAAGEYKFVALKVGRYDMQAALDGFQTYRRAVEVGLGRTVKNDFVMTLGAVTDVIEVTGEAPLVDVTSTVSGISVNMGDLDGKMPISRDATSVVLLAPATMQGDSAFDWETPGQNLNSMGGASVAESAYQVNGLNVTNFRNGLGSSFVPMEFVEELQVKTGGYEAEYGRATGGVVNMVTKSGTNSFHGNLSAYFRPESLQEQEPDTYLAWNQSEETEEMELNASIGGPIVKDHLFFFAFVRYWDRDRLGVATTTATRFEISQPYYGGKVDWNITANHRLEATYISDSVDTDTTDYQFDIDTGLGEAGFGGVQERGGDNYIGKYTGIFTENFLVAAQYGVNDFNRTNASEGDPCAYSWDMRGGGQVKEGCWVNWSRGAADDSRNAGRLDADWYLGRHSLRGGIDSEANVSNDLTQYSGGIYFLYLDAAEPTTDYPYEVRIRHYQNQGSFDVNQQAIYAQDSWAINSNMTFNFGVRYEEFENKNSNGDTFIKIDNQWAPRLGFVWDLSGQGRTKLYASAGLYYLPIPSNTNVRMAGGELFDQAFYQWTGEKQPDAWPTGYTDCGVLNLPSCGNQGSVGDLVDYALYADGEIPDPETTLSTNFEPMAQQELVVGYEQMVGNNWSLGARVVWREFDQVIEDSTIDQGLFEKYGIVVDHNEYRLMNPGSDFEGFYDLDGDGVNDPISISAEELGYPEAIRKYYALELSFRKRFSNNWMLEGSYTWSHLYGNYEGMVLSDNGQDDAGITIMFDFPGLMDNSYGNLQQDRRHNLKIFGAYTFDFGLQLGANATYRTGRPINSFGVHPTDPWAQDYGADSFYTFGEPTPRGNYGSTDDVLYLDTMFKYDFNWGVNWFVRLDIFNLFDQSAVTEVQEAAEQESSSPPNYVANPNYGLATHYQTPRSVRFGIGLNF